MGRSRCYGSGRELQKCKNAVKHNLSSTHFHQPYVVLKLSIKEAQRCSLGIIGCKTKKIWPSKLLGLKLRIFSLDEREAFAFSRNDIFPSTQLHNPYGVGKLSISRAKTCNFCSVGCEKKNLRLSIGQFERKFSSLEMAHFFHFFFAVPFRSSVPSIHTCNTCV